MQRIFNAGFFLFHLDFSSSTYLDDCNTASQFGQTLLQLLFVVIRGGIFDLLANLGHTAFDIRLLASTVNDGGVVLIQNHTLGVTQVLQGGGVQAQADFFGNHGTTGQDGNILQHGLATVTKARSLNSSHFDNATHVVDNQSRQSFAFNIFGNDQQRAAGFGNSFQNRQQLTDVGNFLVNQQQQRLFQLSHHGVRLVDEVRRQVAAVKLHPFNNSQFVFQTGAFFNGNYTFFANLFHRVGDDVTNGAVRVGRNGTYLGNGLGVGTWLGLLFELLNNGTRSTINATLQIHRVHAGGNRLQTFIDDSLSQNGSSGCAISGFVVGLGGNILDQLGAHILETVFQFDFFGNRNAILGDDRSTKAALQYHIAALWTKGSLYRISQGVDTSEHFFTAGIAELNFFSSHLLYTSKISEWFLS